MAKSVHLEVITPSELFYRGDVEMVIVRTFLGDEGFMANHAWATKLLDAGELWIREAGATDFKVAALASGYIDVRQNIVIYSDAAEWPEQIDVPRAERAKENAENWLREHRGTDEDDREYGLYRMAVARAKTRLSVKGGGKRLKR